MFGCGMGTLTTGQRLIVNAISGGVIGMPSGAIGAAIESLDDVAAGRMSLSDYLISIGLGSAMGLGLGVGLSWLPINGLYRSGGRPGVPFSGEPVTPRWMLSGPFSQFQTNFTAPPDFHNLPANELPPPPGLPVGTPEQPVGTHLHHRPDARPGAGDDLRARPQRSLQLRGEAGRADHRLPRLHPPSGAASLARRAPGATTTP
jgi:hypothetical protein